MTTWKSIAKYAAAHLNQYMVGNTAPKIAGKRQRERKEGNHTTNTRKNAAKRERYAGKSVSLQGFVYTAEKISRWKEKDGALHVR
ncbi:hypothetical protein [uncultured Ruminococcus sp.]|uniref:hypothetical protein n=1 Tax=uncultured Ruminococcus sp. TaxID=165186 RepID=UPI0026345400|nr:hypothetical protein [uncultured Ruminococcus sp.]